MKPAAFTQESRQVHLCSSCSGGNSAHSAAPLKCEITVSITQPCSDVMCTGMFLAAAADDDDADET